MNALDTPTCPLTINLTINRGDPEELPHVA